MLRIRITLLTQIFYSDFENDFKDMGNYLYLLIRNYFHSNPIDEVLVPCKKCLGKNV